LHRQEINLPHGIFSLSVKNAALDHVLTISASGWLDGMRRVESPNFGPRPDSVDIRLIVVHAISLPPGEYGGGHVQLFFSNRLDPALHPYFEEIQNMQVSAHCLIERDGALTQFVSFLERAWHAGESSWRGSEDCNDFSIGIELEGCDEDAFSVAQYQRLAALVIALRKQYPAIGDDALCGHSDIAPGRKTDPGPKFDWDKLEDTIKQQS
jgi:AmpD protein